MELIRGLHNLRARHHGCVLTIGNFDGVHLGHQAVIERLGQVARQLQLPAAVMTFEPLPREFFAPQVAPARLSNLAEKVSYLAQHAVDHLLCVRFDKPFAAMGAVEFIEQLLVKQLGVRHLVVGDDFRFGAKRQGDFAMLQQAGQRYGFTVDSTESFCLNTQRISSTLVREALATGDLAHAAQMLGRPFSITGRVSHGEKKGRQLGFPTANLALKRHLTPVTGVFAVQVFGVDSKPVAGVANIGHRPTMNGERTLLEVHLFDFCGDLYGRRLKVELHQQLRQEMRFASFDALREQIARDALQAREYFALGAAHAVPKMG